MGTPRRGKIARTIPFIYGVETADLGVDLYTPVTQDYAQNDNKFSGTIKKVVVKVGPVGQAVPVAALD